MSTTAIAAAAVAVAACRTAGPAALASRRTGSRAVHVLPDGGRTLCGLTLPPIIDTAGAELAGARLCGRCRRVLAGRGVDLTPTRHDVATACAATLRAAAGRGDQLGLEATVHVAVAAGVVDQRGLWLADRPYHVSLQTLIRELRDTTRAAAAAVPVRQRSRPRRQRHRPAGRAPGRAERRQRARSFPRIDLPAPRGGRGPGGRCPAPARPPHHPCTTPSTKGDRPCRRSGV